MLFIKQIIGTNMKILALTLERCSGCSLLIDDKIIFSSSEERYTRKKSDSFQEDWS